MNPEQNGGQPLPPTPDQSPNLIPTPTPAATNNPYEFIMAPQKFKKTPLALPGNSMVQRITIVAGGLILLIILGVIASSILSSGSKEKTAGMLTVLQDQTELIRVATDGTQNTTTLPGQNLAQTVLASVTSDNTSLLAYTTKNGQKFAPKLLMLKHSITTDTTLAGALENSAYDSTFKDIIQSDLESYTVALQKAYKTNPGPKGQALLSSQYDTAKLLLDSSKAN